MSVNRTLIHKLYHMSQMPLNVLNGEPDSPELLSALLIVTPKQTSPLIALFIFDEEHRVNGPSNHAYPMPEYVPICGNFHLSPIEVWLT